MIINYKFIDFNDSNKLNKYNTWAVKIKVKLQKDRKCSH